jgi:hypothetical protein
MDLEGSKEEETISREEQNEATTPAGRPPPIILTSAVNLIQLQKELKDILKGSFEFRNTKNSTTVLTRVVRFLSNQILLPC